jgi:hypothetical protein
MVWNSDCRFRRGNMVISCNQFVEVRPVFQRFCEPLKSTSCFAWNKLRFLLLAETGKVMIRLCCRNPRLPVQCRILFFETVCTPYIRILISLKFHIIWVQTRAVERAKPLYRNRALIKSEGFLLRVHAVIHGIHISPRLTCTHGCSYAGA